MLGKDDYPYSADPPDQVDQWQFYKRECTSFAAWRINNDMHVQFQNNYKGQQFGNAMDWAGAAQRAGVRVDTSPQVGCVAQFPPNVGGAGAFGHVAVVIGISGGNITVEDYNYEDQYDSDTQYNYSQHVVPAAGLNFLHFNGSNGGGGLTGTAQASPTLNVRSGPGTDHPVVGTVAYGESVAISCWTKGTSVTATWQDGSTWTTDVWDRLEQRVGGTTGYVSDAWIDTEGNSSKQTSPC